MRRPLSALFCLLLLPAIGLAQTDALHPLAAPLGGADAGLSLGLNRLDWGPTTLSYSQSWGGGQSQSLGLLTRDLRIPLGGNLDFSTRFGVAFTPGADLSGQQQAGRFVLPFAALDWQPGESFLLHLEVGQGLGSTVWDPFAPLGWRRAELPSSTRDTLPPAGD